jgi:hypothetical protein
MQIGVFRALLAAALLTGCGKKEAAEPQLDASPKPSAAAATSPDPMVKAGLEDIDQKVQAQQYEAAVGALVAMHGIPKNDQQYNEYMKRLRDVNGALSQRAAQGDQQAIQSQMMLARMIKGR